MKRQRHSTSFALAPLALAIAAAVPAARAQTTFVAIDLFHTELGGARAAPGAPRLIGSSPLLLARDPADAFFVRVLTLEQSTGAQLGQAVNVQHPPDPCHPPEPGRVMYSREFMPGEVFVLGPDLSMMHFPLAILPDGTPDPGAGTCVDPLADAAQVGKATSITELPAVQFRDQLPRLILGTDMGLLVAVIPGANGPELEFIADVVGGEPISTIHALPQAGYIAVGVMTPSGLHGIQYDGPTAGAARIWTRTVSAPQPCFDVFDLGHPPDPGLGPLHLVLTDEVTMELELAEVPVDATGTEPLRVTGTVALPAWFGSPVHSPVAGSLLMLMGDGTTVYYNPDFDETLGLGECIVDVAGDPPAGCGDCRILMNGDVNLSGTLTSADIIALVNYVFKSGPEPQPCRAAGDVNCNGAIVSSDIIYLVNHVFKGGLPPCDVCPMIPAVWSCS